MANKFLLALALLTFHLIFVPAFATNVSTEGIVLDGGTCSAPPPDSFRITTVSTDFISLNWNSVGNGASYNLTILKKNELGNWDLAQVISNITETFYTSKNLESGKEYRFKIATCCSNGEPSELTAIKDGITLILELTIGGRTPLNPAQPSCINIPYKNYAWVGFRVSTVNDNGEIESNLFEVEEDPGNPDFGYQYNNKIRIKRVINNHQIVATNLAGMFPINNNPISSENPFCMRDFGNMNNPKIGRVQYLKNLNFQTINLCVSNIDPQWQWNTTYTYEPLVALKVKSLDYPSSENRSLAINYDKIVVQNPFNDEIRVFIPNSTTEPGEYLFWLTNSSGQIIMSRELHLDTGQLTLPASSIAPGFYILSIKANGLTQNHKIIKFD